MNKVELSVSYAERIALDDKHGYDQVDRWGYPNFDCSGLVITALEQAGIPAKTCGATYTGNMYNSLIKAGMKDVTALVNLKTCEGMKRGDVLLNREHHTAFYLGNKQVVHASINEKGGIVGGKSGDQTGKEICIRSYYNYPWTDVLRYEEKYTSKFYSNEEVAKQVLQGKWGNGEERKERLTSAGYSYDIIQKIVNDMTSGKVVSNKKTNEEIAKEVLQGKWGNGQERREKLTSAGYSYDEIQKIVNEMLKK